MAKIKSSRLAEILTDFAKSFELPHKLDPDENSVDLGIPFENRLIFASYSFDASEDSYEFGAALGKVNEVDIPIMAEKLILSRPIRGITERLDQKGKLIVFGSRDGLNRMSDSELQSAFLDDLSRITRSSDHFEKLREKDE